MKIRASSPSTQALLQAVADGRIDDVMNHSEHDGYLHTSSCSSGCKALHWAAGNGHKDMVDYLLQPRQDKKKPFFHVDCPAVGKSQGRTALHYACRNGHFHIVRKLVEEYNANPNPKARHSVTPLQLAVWQGRLEIAKYLVNQCKVDPCQINDYDCGLVHWMGLAPKGASVVDMARWLHEDLGLPLRNVVQRQGHSALHKAAWGGHLELCQYLHQVAGMWDDKPDAAGNFAADLARMGQHDSALVDYLQRDASLATWEACQLLNVSTEAQKRTVSIIQHAYYAAAKTCHPDGKERRRKLQLYDASKSTFDFDKNEKNLVAKFQSLTRAYQHLIVCATNDKDNEKLLQNHATHELPRLLTHDGSNPVKVDEECFEARLLQVVRQNSRGLDISNLVKKWKQVWPGIDFPERSHASLHQWLRQEVSHVVTVRAGNDGVLRLFPKM